MMKRLINSMITLFALLVLGASASLTGAQGETPTPRPAITLRGPVIGPGYEPPTLTPIVTNTPDPAVTAVPGTVAATPETTATLPNLDPNRMGIQIDSNLEQADWDNVMYRLG